MGEQGEQKEEGYKSLFLQHFYQWYMTYKQNIQNLFYGRLLHQ